MHVWPSHKNGFENRYLFNGYHDSAKVSVLGSHSILNAPSSVQAKNCSHTKKAKLCAIFYIIKIIINGRKTRNAVTSSSSKSHEMWAICIGAQNNESVKEKWATNEHFCGANCHFLSACHFPIRLADWQEKKIIAATVINPSEKRCNPIKKPICRPKHNFFTWPFVCFSK